MAERGAGPEQIAQWARRSAAQTRAVPVAAANGGAAEPDKPAERGLVPGGSATEAGQPGPETAKLFTEDAPPVDPGRTEIEFDYAYFGARQAVNGAGQIRRRGRFSENDFVLRAKHGLVEDLDIAAVVGFTRFVDPDLPTESRAPGGLSELSFGAKWRFFAPEKWDFAVSYIPGFSFPIAGRTAPSFLGPPQDFHSFDHKFAMTKNIGRFTASADIGYAIPIGRVGDSRGNMIADVAVGYQVLPWLQPEVELNWTHSFLRGGGEPDSLAVTAGVLLPFGDRWRVQVGVQQEIFGRNTDITTALLAGILLRL